MNETVTPLDSANVLQEVLQTWQPILNLDRLDPDEDLRTLGATSLMFMMAFMRTQEIFPVDTALADLFATRTAREFADVIRAAANPSV